MNNAAKMMMMQRGGDSARSGSPRNEGTRMGYASTLSMDDAEMRRSRDSRGRYMEAEDGPELRSYMGYDLRTLESRFRDRRGREHYDNGRYAPRNGYEEDTTGESDMPRGSLDFEDEGERPKPHLLGRGGTIGFASHDGIKPFDQQTAQEWTRSMRREDGGTGPKWTMDQARSLMTQIGAQGIHPAEFWAVLNAMYSDYCKTLKKFGMDRPEVYAELARAWLDDKDAVPHKAAAYYEHVVKH